LSQAFRSALLLYALNWACAACGGALVGSEPNFCAVMSVDDPAFDPAELATVEPPHLVILNVGSRFAVPEVNSFFITCDVCGRMTRFVVEGGFHQRSSLTSEAIAFAAFRLFPRLTTKTT